MPPPDPNAYYNAIDLLDRNKLPLQSFIRRSFSEPRVERTTLLDTFVEDLPHLLDFLAYNEKTRGVVDKWVKGTYTQKLKSQVKELSLKRSGFHFSAKGATSEQMKEVNMERMAKGIKEKAPDVWDMMGHLLQADPEVVKRREKARAEREKQRAAGGGTRTRRKRMDILEDEDDARVADLIGDDEDEPEDIEDQLETQSKALIQIVSFVHSTLN